MRRIEVVARALATAELVDASALRVYSPEARLAVRALRLARRAPRDQAGAAFVSQA